jgi:hypothetical protein
MILESIVCFVAVVILREIYGFASRQRYPTPHPSTIPGMRYDPVMQEWIDKKGLPYGCASPTSATRG